MPTALSIVQNEDGFAIASDSFHYDMDSGTALPGYIQKIFPFNVPNPSLAYCLCGIITFSAMDKRGQPSVFNLLTEVPNVLATMTTMATLRQFAEVFGKRICTRLRKATTLTPPRIPTITHILLLGYYNGTPGIAVVEIRSANRFEYDVDPKDVPHNTVNGCFPGEILKRFYVDPVFEPFRARDCPHSGIQVPLEIARQAVLACYDQEVRTKYPEANVVGGPIHLAKITHAAGFEWINPPQSVAI
jgi:hypothetical protein